MTTEAARRQDVPDDSEATQRQVQGVLMEPGAGDCVEAEQVEKVVSEIESRPVGLRDLVSLLMTTHREIMSVIDSLRRGRGFLEQAAMERLKSTHQKLAEVSTATEMAATGMLDGLERAPVLVDHLETAPDPGDENAPEAPRLRRELREELHQLIDLLQSQDITAQELGYAGGVLLDIEERMVQLSKVFDLRGLGVGPDPDRAGDEPQDPDRGARTCDPNASTLSADSRQALADEIFEFKAVRPDPDGQADARHGRIRGHEGHSSPAGDPSRTHRRPDHGGHEGRSREGAGVRHGRPRQQAHRSGPLAGCPAEMAACGRDFSKRRGGSDACDSEGALPVYARGEAMERVGGDSGILTEMMQIFVTTWPEVRERMQRAKARADGLELSQLAHRLKGGAGALAARQLHALLATCEQRWREGEISLARDEIAALDAGVEAFRARFYEVSSKEVEA